MLRLETDRRRRDSPDVFGKRLDVTVMRKDVSGYYVMPANCRGLRFYDRSKQ